MQTKKVYFSILVTIAFVLNSYTQSIKSSTKYKQIGLVWGLLKYHHPEISNGKYNWDLEFIQLFDKVESIENQAEMNDFLFEFVSKFGFNNFKKRKINSEKIFLKNIDFNWIDPSVFGEKLTSRLLEIKDNSNINNYYASTNSLAKMISFKNEKGFKNFDYRIKSHRILLLYSFWNVIQYWNVNKYLMDTKWIDNLDMLTEEFVNSKTKYEFEIAKSKLFSKLNDSHSFNWSTTVSDSLFKYRSIFSVKAIKDSLLIKSIYNQTLAKKDDIELGDVIVKVNNKNVSSYLNEKIAPLLSVSNSSFLKKWSTFLFYYHKDSINVDIVKKNGVQVNKFIHLYTNFLDSQPIYLNNPKKDNWYFIKEDIAYINLENITKKEIGLAFKQMANTRGLILDLRNYPKNISNSDIAEYLFPKKKEFIKVLFPIENNPAYGEYDGEASLRIISDPFNVGTNNPDYYKGKVMLLVDNNTISKAEFIGMAIQQSPNCTTIGEQTAGSVMNVVNYMLPDKSEIYFTGLGAFYPNGEGVQRNGLHIDHYVNESAKNYDPELYLKEAIRLIESKN